MRESVHNRTQLRGRKKFGVEKKTKGPHAESGRWREVGNPISENYGTIAKIGGKNLLDRNGGGMEGLKRELKRGGGGGVGIENTTSRNSNVKENSVSREMCLLEDYTATPGGGKGRTHGRERRRNGANSQKKKRRGGGKGGLEQSDAHD